VPAPLQSLGERTLAAGLVDLNGATNVTIDGIGTGGNALTLSNTTGSTPGGTSTIRFINGAQNNTITRCTILGSAIPAPGSSDADCHFNPAAYAHAQGYSNTQDSPIATSGTGFAAVSELVIDEK